MIKIIALIIAFVLVCAGMKARDQEIEKRNKTLRKEVEMNKITKKLKKEKNVFTALKILRQYLSTPRPIGEWWKIVENDELMQITASVLDNFTDSDRLDDSLIPIIKLIPSLTGLRREFCKKLSNFSSLHYPYSSISSYLEEIEKITLKDKER